MSEIEQHTPGPWSVGRGPKTGQLCVQSETTWICGQLQSDNFTRIEMDETEANARLIAAAPELLYVAKRAEDFIAFLDLEHERLSERAEAADLLAAIRAAIAKATPRVTDADGGPARG